MVRRAVFVPRPAAKGPGSSETITGMCTRSVRALTRSWMRSTRPTGIPCSSTGAPADSPRTVPEKYITYSRRPGVRVRRLLP